MNEVRFSPPLPICRVLTHICITNHDCYCLPKTSPDTLLDIWYSMSGANGGNVALAPLCREGAQLGEEVVFDAIIKPTVQKIIDVATSAKVG